MRGAILPGATLGVFGGGQLGRMFAFAAQRMGYRVAVFTPEADSPAGQVCGNETVAAYEDLEAVRRFARGVAAATVEFENVPGITLEVAAEETHVRPGAQVLRVAQNRLREREFLRGHGFPATPWARIDAPGDVPGALAAVGLPAVVKTAGFGYDGKGQRRVTTVAEAEVALAELGLPLVAEAFVAFEREVSVIVARGADGAMADFGVIENRHEHHILDLSVRPSGIAAEVQEEARSLGRAIAEALEVVGLLCVEFFVLPGGALLVNELAPRPHNSGHLTIEACATSQFEQQVRMTAGLPAGATNYHAPAAMAQLLGDLWRDGEPNWAAALAEPGVALHLYGKAEARAGRKMGHLTALGATAEDAVARVLRARERLREPVAGDSRHP